jgi:hypothetical protein
LKRGDESKLHAIVQKESVAMNRRPALRHFGSGLLGHEIRRRMKLFLFR